MSDLNLTFSRLYLREVMKVVRKHIPVEVRKKSWTWKSGRYREFQIPTCELFPNGVHYYTRDHDLYYVRAKGWELALQILGKDEEIEEPEEEQ